MSKCKSCGEKPQKSRAFPSAVVEINNPEQLVLLRKVVIPASMPEETNPPVIGRYKNVILQYEDTNHLYIYSSDGIPTPIEANIPQEILDRIDTLEADVDNLERDLADETEARQTGDSDLSDRIDGVVDDLADEADARELADEQLEDAIDTKQDQLTAGANIAIVDESGVLTISAVDTIYDDTQIRQELADETLARQQADNTLQSEIDTIVASSDVKDIVGTYAELEDYDTSTLGDRDIIKVLQDETQLDQTTYYRWSTSTETFSLIGAEGPYYTKAQTNELLDEKQDELAAGENITIADESGSLVISATDTTYTAGYGLELNGTEFSVDPDIVQDTLTAGDNITIEDESGSLVISATDTTYTAGTGLALNGTQFSVDTTAIATQSDLTAGLATKQDTLTAGTNIQINNNTISATDTTYTHFTGATASTDGVQGLVPGPLAGDEDKFLKADGTWDTVGSSVNVVQATGTSTADVMSQNAVTSMVYADPDTQFKIKIGAGTSSSEGPEGVEIGHNASATGNKTIAIGADTQGSGARSVSIGASASSSYHLDSVALGSGAKTSRNGEVNIGAGTSGRGYLNSNYRVLGGVYDPQSAHDAATKGYVDTAVSAKQDVLTAGDNITIAEESGDLVISATSTGPNVVQTTGTSTTDVMSQNAVSSMVFSDVSTREKVQIGNGAVTLGAYSIAIGSQADTATYNYGVAIGGGTIVSNAAHLTGNGGVAIGYSASAANNAVAVGSYANATAQGEFAIGASSNRGYNNSAYRLLTGLYDPQSDHDAATKSYVDNSLLGKQDALTAGSGISIADESGSLVISTTVAEPDEFTSSEWNALWS